MDYLQIMPQNEDTCAGFKSKVKAYESLNNGVDDKRWKTTVPTKVNDVRAMIMEVKFCTKHVPQMEANKERYEFDSSNEPSQTEVELAKKSSKNSDYASTKIHPTALIWSIDFGHSTSNKQNRNAVW
eukprot:12482375-Ditylum_brightwellii.AAC.1